MDLWAYQHGVRMAFSRLGKPTDNAFVESFNGTFRAECLNAHWFASLTEAQRIVETWRAEYNESRPHRALGEKTPNEFAKEIAASRDFLGQKLSKTHPRVGMKNPGRSYSLGFSDQSAHFTQQRSSALWAEELLHELRSPRMDNALIAVCAMEQS
jgi:hypothetical protein